MSELCCCIVEIRGLQVGGWLVYPHQSQMILPAAAHQRMNISRFFIIPSLPVPALVHSEPCFKQHWNVKIAARQVYQIIPLLGLLSILSLPSPLSGQ